MAIRHIYKALRLIVVVSLLVLVAVPAALYVGLSLPSVQDYARKTAGRMLSERLGVDVTVGNLSITPFNRVSLRNVAIVSEPGDTIVKARRLGAGFGLTDFIFNRRLVLNYVEAVGLDLRVWRDSAGAPLNIAPVISRLSRPGGDGGVPDLRINAIVVRQSAVSFDDLSAPMKPLGRFDPAHIRLADIRADLRLNLVKATRSIEIELSRLATTEARSGLTVTDLSTRAQIIKAPAPSPEIGNITLGYTELKLPSTQLSIQPTIITLLPEPELSLTVSPGSYLTISDLAPVIPESVTDRPGKLPLTPFSLDLVARANARAIDIKKLNVSTLDGAIRIEAPEGLVAEGIDSISNARFNIPALTLAVMPSAAPLLPFPLPGTMSADTIATPILPLRATIEGEGTMGYGSLAAHIESSGIGNAFASLDYQLGPDRRSGAVDAHLDMDKVNPAAIVAVMNAAAGRVSTLPLRLPHELTATIETAFSFTGFDKLPDGNLSTFISSVSLPVTRTGHSPVLTDIALYVTSERGKIEATLESANDGAAILADLSADTGDKSATFDVTLDDFDPSIFGLTKTEGRHLSFTATGIGNLEAPDAPLPVSGSLIVNDLRYGDLKLTSIDITSDIPEERTPSITLKSDILNAELRGTFDPQAVAADVRALAASLYPDIFPPASELRESRNNFSIEGRLLSTTPLDQVVKLPIQVHYPIDFAASLSSEAHRASIRLEAPYLWQGNKEIDATTIHIQATGSSARLSAATRMPTKNGMMDLLLQSSLPPVDSLSGNRRAVTTSLQWNVDASRDFSGDISFEARLRRDQQAKGSLMADVDILPGSMTFNDTIWAMDPSRITFREGRIAIDNFNVGRSDQHIKINGVVSSSPADNIIVSLADVDLDYVFETLNIPNAMFGGIATGNVYGSGVLGKDVSLYTPDLFVRGLKYNFSLMGDTHIRASFDPGIPAVNLHAVVEQPNKLRSYIDGYIKPTTEGYIDLDFKADRIEVGFMKPFMSAFASDVKGFASGQAHLFGTFHDVNMSGDIFAEDLALTLDFTGVTYYATDSVHLVPGYIDLEGITLRDRDGHTARLGGYLRHTNFHEPRFQFRITGADDLLVYDLPESPDRRWYGTIYGDGSANIIGVPGHIDIGVDMTTAPRSAFAFILSDTEEAYDYRFITFRDRDAADDDPLAGAVMSGIPAEVFEIRQALAKKVEEEGTSVYDMSITVRATPDALLTVVMDPVGGDAINARGSGDMTLTYNSASEDLGLRGDYTLDNGTYNFTFQDIIRKDFRINPGSTIRFTGDPYAAQLDIEAAYRLTANLSDLDESFLDDSELTRTTVPVDALIKVTGNMLSPDIAYDFAFPTLKDDIKRKVNSIVSTDDMRARQMLYLLALNRFYTPEYMSATKGNELFSVASSTISSQISNILGSLSENWSISPNVRSDRGDFSDVEFDLALSSSLLNNRLLFNGNFGYRDKSLNNNSFIGDFDLEYLLNRTGSLRLKAYNRYNDQNFYVKNALTTQGVGIVFRRDFDSFAPWFRSLLGRGRRKETSQPTPQPDVISEQPDTVNYELQPH